MSAETQERRDALLTVREAAAEARVSPPHMYRLIERGVVPAVRVGEDRGPLRVIASEFRSWLYADPENVA